MHSQLNNIVARERIADLHRSAYRARRRGTAVSNGALATVGQVQETISIRRAGEADSAALLLLAELDSSPPLSGDVLIAHVADEPRAAIEVDTGAVIADPFRPTAQVVELLKLRAEGLRPRPGAVRRPRLRRRWASGTAGA